MSKDKRKTETVAFRLDDNVITKLRREAAQKEVSLNMLVGQIFKQHLPISDPDFVLGLP